MMLAQEWRGHRALPVGADSDWLTQKKGHELIFPKRPGVAQVLAVSP
jgi:hypothetical protein